MTWYAIGRAIGGLVLAWGTAALIVSQTIPFFHDRPGPLAAFVWIWLIVAGTFIARLLDWRKTSSWIKDGGTLLAGMAVVIFVSFLGGLIFG